MAAAEGALTATLGKLFALSEAYPDLKANQNMMQLTEELTSTENRIAFARQAYNDGVMEYNTALQLFPASIIAGMFAFAPAELLEATESAQERQAGQGQLLRRGRPDRRLKPGQSPVARSSPMDFFDTAGTCTPPDQDAGACCSRWRWS